MKKIAKIFVCDSLDVTILFYVTTLLIPIDL